MQAIEKALKDCTLFVLFLTVDSINSHIVRFEALLARELIARGLIDRFLVICLDEDAFNKADENWKTYNFVRKPISPQSAARTIISTLLISNSNQSEDAQPFVGRGKELSACKEALAQPGTTANKAIFVSGIHGIGRRTFAHHLLNDVYPYLNRALPEIYLNKLDGYDELFRGVFSRFSPFETVSQKRLRVQNFEKASTDEKATLITQQLERLIDARETLIIVDRGGMLDDSGAMQVPLKTVLSRIEPSRHPTLVLIAERMMPGIKQHELHGTVFSRLNALERDEVRQLIGLLLGQNNINYTREQWEALTDLSDGHPFNVSFMIAFIKMYSIDILLADPESLNQIKYKRSSQFISRCAFSEVDVIILGTMKDFSSLNFELICTIADTDQATVARSLERLMDLHILEAFEDTYTLSAPLRNAIERDPRVHLEPSERRRVLRTLAGAFAEMQDNTRISMSIVDTAIITALQAETPIPDVFAAFLLPSHKVWLGRRRYDERRYKECIRLMDNAIDNSNRLSPAGIVEACRFLCLAATRMSEDETFRKGIRVLRGLANDSWASSNIHFLIGFNARFEGEIPQAEENFRKSLEYSDDNFSAIRELASICATRGDFESAEQFARKVLRDAEDNAYILDVMLKALIGRNRGNYRPYEDEIEQLFFRLQKSSDANKKSFYATRRAEYLWTRGEINEACRLIDNAIVETPGIFDVHLLRARIYLDRPNLSVVRDEIGKMEAQIRRRTQAEGQRNLRPLIELRAELHLIEGKFEEARKLYANPRVFSAEETERLIKGIDREQAYRQRGGLD